MRYVVILSYSVTLAMIMAFALNLMLYADAENMMSFLCMPRI